MNIEKLKPGMTVYDVGRQKMGNTTISTVAVWPVRIVAVDVEHRRVEASWNFNAPRIYFERSWQKWRLKQPELVKGAFGSYRLKRRSEKGVGL